MLEFYQNTYWTRLITVGQQEIGPERKQLLGPDIVDECSAVANLAEVDADRWSPLFEPTDFNNERGPLTVEGFRLSDDELRDWAE